MAVARNQAAHHIVASAYVVHAGCVLLVHHRKLSRWLAPGGHLRPGETPDECAAREVLEETGVAARVIDEDGAMSYPGLGVEMLPRPLVVQLEQTSR